jgi:ArsR family transcriptional regulator, zinc-responsive transcriptional repressor
MATAEFEGDAEYLDQDAGPGPEEADQEMATQTIAPPAPKGKGKGKAKGKPKPKGKDKPKDKPKDRPKAAGRARVARAPADDVKGKAKAKATDKAVPSPRGGMGRRPASAVPPSIRHAVDKAAAGRGRWTPTASQIGPVSNLLSQANNPTRALILMGLREGALNVGDISAALGTTQPAISHHLTLMRLSGVVAQTRAGKNNFYALTEVGERLADVVAGMIADLG